MGTRAQVRFATREEGVTFSEHPDNIHAQFYVHNDGYPSFLGVEIANSLIDSTSVDGLEIEELCAKHGDLEYIYYVWQSKYKSTWISIFKVAGYTIYGDRTMEYEDECIFVGEPQKLLEKYD
jgi:hypothetical protein